MSEPDEMITWATSAGTGTQSIGYSQSIGSVVSSPTWTTTTTPWSASTDPQMVKAWMSAVIERLEHLQQRIRELDGERRG
jgi:hypothetical protein